MYQLLKVKILICSLRIVDYLCSPKKINMLIIDTRDSESLDKALKKYKKKFEKAGILKQLKSRQAFTKPSVKRRGEILKAVYRDEVTRQMEAQ